MAGDGYGQFGFGYAYPQPAGYQFRGKAGPVQFGNPLHQGAGVFLTGFRGGERISGRAGNRAKRRRIRAAGGNGAGRGKGVPGRRAGAGKGYRVWIGGGSPGRRERFLRPGAGKRDAVPQGVVQGGGVFPLILNPGQKAYPPVHILKQFFKTPDPIFHELRVPVGNGVYLGFKPGHRVPTFGKDIFRAGSPPDIAVKIQKEKTAKQKGSG
jgi:hypothetical protein